MPRGRPPKPTMLHKLHGTYREDRNGRPREPIAEGDLDMPPDWLNAEQLESWEYAIEHAPPGLLRMIDRGVLALWVEAEARHRMASTAQSVLNKGSNAPFLIKDHNGVTIMSPYVEIIDRAAKVMLKCITEMGFSPSARPRIKMPEDVGDEGEGETAEVIDPWAMLRIIPGGKEAPD